MAVYIEFFLTCFQNEIVKTNLEHSQTQGNEATNIRHDSSKA